MVVIKLVKYSLLSFLIFLVVIHSAIAEMMEQGRTKVKFLFNFYEQASSDGNQVADDSGREDVSVVEPMIFLEHQITENTSISGLFVADTWTAASDSRLDVSTGASGEVGIDKQERNSGKLGVRTEQGKYGFSGDVGFSDEYDYKSQNISMGITRSFAEDNFLLALMAQYYKDKVGLFRDISKPLTARIEKNLNRTINSFTLSGSQILTPKDILEVSLTYVRAAGELESTASTVNIANQRQVESLPDMRIRNAISMKWVHGLSDTSSINLDYRYYADDWGIRADTAYLAYLFEVNRDEDFIELFIRHHDQAEADYFQKSFRTPKKYMTSDSDLESFAANELGITHYLKLKKRAFLGREFSNMEWTNGIVSNQRSNGLRYSYFQTSLGMEF